MAQGAIWGLQPLDRKLKLVFRYPSEPPKGWEIGDKHKASQDGDLKDAGKMTWL